MAGFAGSARESAVPYFLWTVDTLLDNQRYELAQIEGFLGVARAGGRERAGAGAVRYGQTEKRSPSERLVVLEAGGSRNQPWAQTVSPTAKG
jgi:hypothetical protein